MDRIERLRRERMFLGVDLRVLDYLDESDRKRRCYSPVGVFECHVSDTLSRSELRELAGLEDEDLLLSFPAGSPELGPERVDDLGNHGDGFSFSQGDLDVLLPLSRSLAWRSSFFSRDELRELAGRREPPEEEGRDVR